MFLFWAFVTPVLLMFLAIPADAGLVYIQKAEMQNAADAAALAAAQDLPSASGAFSTGEAVSGQHGYPSGGDVSVTVTTPYGGNPNLVEVLITADARTVFGGGLGLVLNVVTTRAVAQKREAEGPPVLFTIETDCGEADALELSGSDMSITGRVHSNSNVTVNGSQNVFVGPVEHAEGGGCGIDISGSGNSLTPMQGFHEETPLDQDDFDAFLADPVGRCHYVIAGGDSADLAAHNEFWKNDDPNTNELRPGVYCSSHDIIVSGQFITGFVTLIAADEIKLSGADWDLSAFYQHTHPATGRSADVLAYSARSEDPGIDASGGGGRWRGCLFAPDSQIRLQGSDGQTLEGCVVAKTIQVSGSELILQQLEESTGAFIFGLVE